MTAAAMVEATPEPVFVLIHRHPERRGWTLAKLEWDSRRGFAGWKRTDVWGPCAQSELRHHLQGKTGGVVITHRSVDPDLARFVRTNVVPIEWQVDFQDNVHLLTRVTIFA